MTSKVLVIKKTAIKYSFYFWKNVEQRYNNDKEIKKYIAGLEIKILYKLPVKKVWQGFARFGKNRPTTINYAEFEYAEEERKKYDPNQVFKYN